MACAILFKLKEVLYCRPENSWKLTDFGISAEATSSLLSTTQSRGTSSYRAPELLKEEARFNKQVDIWALGCVLYELATGKRAFRGDWAVLDYSRGSIEAPTVPNELAFCHHHITETVHELLDKEAKQRPNASGICNLLLSYYRFFGLSVAHQLSSSPSYPLFQEWKELVHADPTTLALFLHLAKAQEAEGQLDIACAILVDVIQGGFIGPSHFIPERFRELKPSTLEALGRILAKFVPFREEAITVYEAAVEFYPEKSGLWTNLAELYIANNMYFKADTVYEKAVNHPARPNTGVMFRELCALCITRSDSIAAGNLCALRRLKFPTEAWSYVMLSNMYAARGDFTKAVSFQRNLVANDKTDWRGLLSDLTEDFKVSRLISEMDATRFKRYHPRIAKK
jgi:serine/threonine protein kinase